MGGAVTSATCEVVYVNYGIQRVTTEYLSVTQFATQTEMEPVWYTGSTTCTPTGFRMAYSYSVLEGGNGWDGRLSPTGYGDTQSTAGVITLPDGTHP